MLISTQSDDTFHRKVNQLSELKNIHHQKILIKIIIISSLKLAKKA